MFFFRKKIDLFSGNNTIFDRSGNSYAILSFETPSRQKLPNLAFSQVFFLKKTCKFSEKHQFMKFLRSVKQKTIWNATEKNKCMIDLFEKNQFFGKTQ